MLPPPPEKEPVAVFLRVKPSTSREREIAKERGEGREVVEGEVVRVETEQQLALLAPKDSQVTPFSVCSTCTSICTCTSLCTYTCTGMQQEREHLYLLSCPCHCFCSFTCTCRLTRTA